ncbi:MAG: hypothetical protein A3J28_18185 [Acidobacteria bacterium RIFCSPLOWO2_12_FULL_60_22]|nr:MAG: hypothetical protein A3J28_18185 [Acidobacteria bacterium RIFCSPLOWO2_12_FULL_60_22]
MKRRLAVVFLFANLASLTFGQGSAGLSGIIRDQSGGVVPGVTVTAVQTETGVTRTTVSNNTGLYSIPNLRPGQYTVRAELSGFRTAVRSEILLRVGDQLALDLDMQVGEVTERVEVTGEAPLVETASAVVGGVVESRAIENLPLNGRGYTELALLQPNVTFSSTAAQAAGLGFGAKISVGGMRPNTMTYTLDGQDVNSFFRDLGSVSGSAAGIEAVREFKVVTSPYSAEFARTGSGEIQVVTKSGTNSFHGSVYEFLRNSALDANKWEDNAFNRGAKAPFRRNQFGASLGGPMVRDKTFFFTNYEGLRSQTGRTRRFLVPDANARNGLLPGAGGVLQPVPGGVNPRIRPYLDLFPLPTGQILGNGAGEYFQVQDAVIRDDYGIARIDHVLSSSTQLYGRFSLNQGEGSSPANFLVDDIIASATKYAAVGLLSVLSPRMVNNLQLFYNRSYTDHYSAARVPGADLLLWGSFQDQKGRPIHGALTPGSPITGLAAVGALNTVSHNVYQLKEDVSLESSRHTLRMGLDLELLQPNISNRNGAGGAYTFTDLGTFLRGVPSQFVAVLPGSQINSSWRQWMTGLYLQDNFRFRPSLTINAGLRYETLTSPEARFGRVSNLRDFANPNASSADITLGNPVFLNPSLKNFGPRIGLSWSPDGKTSVRAGYGMYFDHLVGHIWRVPATLAPPFFRRGTLTTSIAAIDFPNAFFTQGNLLPFASEMQGLQYKMAQPTTMQYSLTVQRQLGSERVVRLGYMGSRGWHLVRITDFNSVRVPTLQSDGRRFFGTTAPARNPNFGGIQMHTSDANSFYHSFSASFDQRFAAGFSGQVSYTFSRSIDDFSNSIGSTDFSNDGQGPFRDAFDPPNDARGLSAFDVRQTLVVSFTYELPWRKGGRWPLSGLAEGILGGWSVNGLASMAGGPPFEPVGSRSASLRTRSVWGELDTKPPNVVAGAKINSVHPQNPDRYFDPTSFALPEPGYFGNLGRNTLIGPGRATVDFSLAKQMALTPISEDFRIQFRAEFFNLFNRSNFSLPGTTLFDPRSFAYRPDVGRISSTRGSSRQIQFALKVLF